MQVACKLVVHDLVWCAFLICLIVTRQRVLGMPLAGGNHLSQRFNIFLLYKWKKVKKREKHMKKGLPAFRCYSLTLVDTQTPQKFLPAFGCLTKYTDIDFNQRMECAATKCGQYIQHYKVTKFNQIYCL